MTLWLLLWVGLFKTKAAASRRMGVLERRGLAQRVKNILFSEIMDGRAQAAWCNAPAKADNYKHNAYALIAVMAFHPHATDIVCGYDTDPATRPDAAFSVNGVRFQLELDCSGKMTQAQVKARWKKYLGDADKKVLPCEDTVLIVTLSENRKRRLVEWSADIKDVARFALLQDLVRHRVKTEWESVGGEKCVVEVADNVVGNVNGNGARK